MHRLSHCSRISKLMFIWLIEYSVTLLMVSVVNIYFVTWKLSAILYPVNVYVFYYLKKKDSVKASDLDHSPYVNSVESWSHPWFDSKFSNLFSHFHPYSFFVSLYRWASLKSTSLYAVGIVWYCFHRYLSFSSFSEHYSCIFNCLQGFSIWMPFHQLISFNWHCLN